MDQDLLQLLHNCIFGPEMKIMMMLSHRVVTWDKIGQSLIIWTYEDVVKSSCQMDKPKWHLLHKHYFCPETWNNFGDKWINEMMPNWVERGFMGVRMIW